jgi:hypothetical protein
MKIKDSFFTFLLILTATVFTFWPCLFADFLNWDDQAHLTMNAFLPFHDWHDVVRLFSFPNTVNGTYIPLTVFSFGLERQLWGLDPFIFHLNNIFLHALTAILVCALARRMGLSLKGACVAALIFALHPMRVESVAWVTERKDVLFGLFYVSTLVLYWDYLKTSRGGYYIGALICAGLSILAKPMALSLPLVLFLMDRMAQRPRTTTMLWDKVPFILALWPIAMVTAGLNVRFFMVGPPQHFLIAAHALMFYVIKFFVPVGLTSVYPVPLPVGWGNFAYGGSAFLLALMLIALWIFRKDRWVVFAFLFYVCSIFVILPIDLFLGDKGIVSERFSYIPMIGFALLVGAAWDRVFFIGHAQRVAVRGWWLACLLCAVLAGMTFNRCLIWRDSMTYWNDVLRTDPDHVFALNNRADCLVSDPLIRARYGLSKTQAYHMALRDLEQAVRWAPRDADSRRNLEKMRAWLGR